MTMNHGYEPHESTVIDMTPIDDFGHEAEARQGLMTDHESISVRTTPVETEAIVPGVGVNDNMVHVHETRRNQDHPGGKDGICDVDSYPLAISTGFILGLLNIFSLSFLLITDIGARFNSDNSDESSRTDTFLTVARICKVDSWIMFVMSIIVGITDVSSFSDDCRANARHMTKEAASNKVFLIRVRGICTLIFVAGTAAFCAIAMIHVKTHEESRLEVEAGALSAIAICFGLFMRPFFVARELTMMPLDAPRKLHFSHRVALAVPATIGVISAVFTICLWRLADGQIYQNLGLSLVMTLVSTVSFFILTETMISLYTESRDGCALHGREAPTEAQ